MNVNKFIGLLGSILILCFWTACDDDAITPTCMTMEQNTSWTAEDFKTDYTIQFPADYEGNGMVGFEGNIFSKNKTDNTITFSYFYCDGLWCADFGQDTLADPPPTSLTIPTTAGNLTLSEKVEFCDGNDEVLAILYHNTEPTSGGRLYMKQGSDFLEALDITYDANSFQEVVDIIKTISEN